MDAANFSYTHTMMWEKDLSLRSIVISLFINDVFLFDLYNILGTLLDTTIQLIGWITRKERIFIYIFNF